MLEEMHSLGYSVEGPCVRTSGTTDGDGVAGGHTAHFAIHENNVYVLETLHRCGVDLSKPCDSGSGSTSAGGQLGPEYEHAHCRSRTPKDLAQHIGKENCLVYLKQVLQK